MTALPSTAYDSTTDDIDPGVRDLLDRKATRITDHVRYQPLQTPDVERRLRQFFATTAPSAEVHGVSRMGGGASKEQFVFSLRTGTADEKYVLRMDPAQTAAETEREFQVLNAYSRHLPAPHAEWLDDEGQHFGQPAAIMKFVPGVTKPTTKSDGPNVTGLGTSFPRELRAELGPQFIDLLARTHAVDWCSEDLPSFARPTPGTVQTALWQVNWMARVWRDDHIEASPIAAVTERWLRQNLPVCESPTMVHGD
ncbi:phosphotransferase family protein [Gordonia aichiensis]|uniref:phosphotransferase family protein n=1 Tax=Gordonia aichiensis TaxID=36820 RepID=UPI003262E8C4